MKGWDRSPRNIRGLAEDGKLENSREKAGGNIKLAVSTTPSTQGLVQIRSALPPSRHSLTQDMGLGEHSRLDFIFPSPLGQVPLLRTAWLPYEEYVRQSHADQGMKLPGREGWPTA